MKTFKTKIMLFLVSVVLSLLSFNTAMGSDSLSLDPTSLSLDFVKHVYSDFRSDQDNRNFNANVEKYVAHHAEEFKKLMLDKKLVKERDDAYFSSKEVLRKEVYKKPEVLYKNDNNMILKIEAEYDYDEFYVEKSGHERKLSESGEIVHYLIKLVNSDGWKIQYVRSNDLTSGIMFPEVLTQNVLTEKTTQNSLNMHSPSRTYSLRRILEERKKIGQETVSELEKKSSVHNSEKSLNTTEPLSTRAGYTKFKAAPLRAYQDKWWNGHNPSYNYYTGNDCTNYASQVFRAGGAPYRKSGSYTWYPYNYGWYNVVGLRTFVLNNTVKGPAGSKTSSMSNLTCGDLIDYNGGSHMIVVYKGGSSDPIVTSHTAHYKGRLKKKYGSGPFTKIMVPGYYH